ncbi:MAG: glycosyltransferase [Alphaproteobacteria bacterium]|nr:glycosyltransferase [Alphaproteobacteria bacterium]
MSDHHPSRFARFQESLLARLLKYPALFHFVRRIFLVFTLLREQRFRQHWQSFVIAKRRAFRNMMDKRRYQKVFWKQSGYADLLETLAAGKGVARAEDLAFPHVEKPTVSIIIPCYGKVDYTLRCLTSLAAVPPTASCEIIVVEDASGDPEAAQLHKVKGITYIDRQQNLGFLRSCNEAATHARGNYIFLLNNDTYVMPGAIDRLVELLCARPDAGMVGSRLLYADGVQQEAGGIIWQDGTAWNYGRRDILCKPEYCYVREVDYISGAAIMLSRSLWNELGGFDEHYLPAYCEDSDLAFRVRQKGLKVLYQPESWIIHYEGVSHGTDVNTGVKAYQVENSRKLKERWKDVLDREHFANATQVMRARDKAKNRQIVLMVDHRLPEPDRDAGSRSMLSFIDALHASGRVVKFWPHDRLADPAYTDLLQRRGVEVLHGMTGLDFKGWLRENGADVDLAFLSRPSVAVHYIDLLRQHTLAPLLFYGHDLHFARLKMEADRTHNVLQHKFAEQQLQQELTVWRSVDCALYPSQDELDAINALEHGLPVAHLSPYAFSVAQNRASVPAAQSGILFVAGFAHAPNVDAALWFCKEILPHILAAKPDVTVTLVGANPTQEVKNLSGGAVRVTGFVTDEVLADYYAKARVSVAPLRFGAGVKLKVVESMQAGVPIVTTSVGAQGLRGLDGALEVQDDPAEFARAVLRFLDDDAAWRMRSDQQIAYVNRTFSVAAQQRDMESAIATATQNRTARVKQ